MSRRIIIRDSAFDDLDEISAYISENSPRASVRFLEEAQKAFALIEVMPGIGTRRDYDNPAFSGMRVWPVPKFSKYLIFYLTTHETVEIVRILHGARNIQSVFSPEENNDRPDI